MEDEDYTGEIPGDPEEYVDLVNPDMDVREIVYVLCDERPDSKVPRELAVEVAVANGMERDTATSYINEFISTVEIVELEDGYIQTRSHFDENFE